MRRRGFEGALCGRKAWLYGCIAGRSYFMCPVLGSIYPRVILKRFTASRTSWPFAVVMEE